MLKMILPALALSALASVPAHAARPVVVELFTSESCSSCPPADAVLASLAKDDRANVLPLAFHVDYWNYLSWRDRYSLPEATARQQQYAAKFGANPYTPQAVVDGQAQLPGFDSAGIRAAIDSARARQAEGPEMMVSDADGLVSTRIGTGEGKGTGRLVGYASFHRTAVRAGENGGVTLDEANAVRGVARAGMWRGPAAAFSTVRPAGEHLAAILQADDGRILAAAVVQER